jgi:hypothetical protein
VAPGQAVPGGGTVTDATNFSISNGGAAYIASLSNVPAGKGDEGIYSVTVAGTQEIVRTGETAPGGGTITGIADIPRINTEGDVLGYVTIDNTQSALLEGNGTSLRTVASYGMSLPDGGLLSSAEFDRLNNQGDVAFWGYEQDSSNGVFISKEDGTLSEIVKTGMNAPGETNTILGLSSGAINDNDQVLIQADISGPGYGTGANTGIYRGSTDGLVTIARSLTATPDSSAYLGGIQASDMNASGTVVMYSNLLTGPSGNSASAGDGIYIGSGGALKTIARTGEESPDGKGVFASVSNGNYINDQGDVAFTAAFANSNYYTELLVGDGTTTTVLASAGQKSPSGSTYTGFDLPRENNTGTVAFTAHLNNSPYDNGIFLTDGTQSITVVQAGSTINGKTIYSVGFDPQAFNDFQQIAYQATFTDGTSDIVVYAPALSWRGNSGGSWDSAANWTVSLEPGEYNDIGIAPTLGGKVIGPDDDTTVNSLTLGGNASGTTALALQQGGDLTATNGVTIKNNGQLGGNGTVDGAVTVMSGASTYPGDPSTTTMSSVHYTNGSKAEFSIEGTRTASGVHTVSPGTGTLAGDYDQIKLTAGTANELQIDSGATLQFDLNSASIATLKANAGVDKYFVFNLDGGGTSEGTFSFLAITDGSGDTYTEALTGGVAVFDAIGLQFDLSYTGDYDTNSLTGGNDLAFTAVDLNPVPEPGTNALLAMGLAMLLMVPAFRKYREGVLT